MAQEMSLISILMAVYEPRMDWLREQLESLNVQTYPNLELIVCDDCSQTVPFESLCNLVKECITAFPVRMLRNEQNVGSNRTFEAMTKEATGQYVAYCDQDDIWYPEKLTVLERAASQPDVSLVCSDIEVVDENGKKTANSITQVRRHHVFHEGREQAEKLLFHNWVTGCTVLLPTALAKAAVPFCPYMVHDHYLAFYCSQRGKIVCIPRPLIRYRIHSTNQTAVMAGVVDKKSYLDIRVNLLIHRFGWILEHMELDASLRQQTQDALLWVKARWENLKEHRGQRTVWKYRSFSPKVAIFELAAAFFPEKLFMNIIMLAKKNRI